MQQRESDAANMIQIVFPIDLESNGFQYSLKAIGNGKYNLISVWFNKISLCVAMWSYAENLQIKPVFR